MKARENYGSIICQICSEIGIIKSNDNKESEVKRIQTDLDTRLATFKFNSKGIKENPVILDLGCGTFPHFFAMTDFFDKFTYIGVEDDNYKEMLLVVARLKTMYPHFNLLAQDASKKEILLQKIKALVPSGKVDLVLIEQCAVNNNSDNLETCQLLKYFLQELVPAVLAESGSLHLEAASFTQRVIIDFLLKERQIPFVRNDYNFLCGEAQKLQLTPVRSEVKTTFVEKKESPVFFDSSPPFSVVIQDGSPKIRAEFQNIPFEKMKHVEELEQLSGGLFLYKKGGRYIFNQDWLEKINTLESGIISQLVKNLGIDEEKFKAAFLHARARATA